MNQQNCKWILRITGPCKKVKLYSFEKVFSGAHCSSEINLAKISVRNNASNNWISASSLVLLVTQREGIWDSRVLWMKLLCPASTTVDTSHFTHQQKWISPSNPISYVTTKFFYPGPLAIWRTWASYSSPEFPSLAPCYYLLLCRVCCPRNLMSVPFSDHKYGAFLVPFCGSLHGDHPVCPFLHYLFLKGWQNRKQGRVWFPVKCRNRTAVHCLSW